VEIGIELENISQELLTPDGGVRLDKLNNLIHGLSFGRGGIDAIKCYNEFLAGKYAYGHEESLHRFVKVTPEEYKLFCLERIKARKGKVTKHE